MMVPTSDGATAHNAKSTVKMLQEFFGDHISSQDMWPPRSPDLFPPIFICGDF
jgi:hypothetical protein